jgi:hypothetical protein
MKPLSVNAGEALRHIKVTIRVKGLRRLRFRLWLGSKLFRIGAAVMGCLIEVLIDGEPV